MPFGPLKIGAHTFAPNLVLAPMSGVTNSAFRRLIREENPGSVGLVVTEFVSIEGLTRNSVRSQQMIRFREIERPISIQIFGYDIDRMVDAALMAQDEGADIVDINSGCPVPKVVRRGGGCELMRQPEHLEQMLSRVKQKLSVPLTLKIRSGWDDKSINAIQIAKIAEDAGVSMLTVHGRTRKDLYRGDADWNLIDQVARSVSIPVLGSGDVIDVESASARYRTAAAGLMIGRGALMNPWVFTEIAAAFRGEAISPRPTAATPQVLERYLDLLLEDYSERAAIGKMKQFASQVVRRVRGAVPVRRALCTSKSLDEFRSVLCEWREYLETGHASREIFFESAEEAIAVEAFPLA